MLLRRHAVGMLVSWSAGREDVRAERRSIFLYDSKLPAQGRSVYTRARYGSPIVDSPLQKVHRGKQGSNGPDDASCRTYGSPEPHPGPQPARAQCRRQTAGAANILSWRTPSRRSDNQQGYAGRPQHGLRHMTGSRRCKQSLDPASMRAREPFFLHTDS